MLKEGMSLIQEKIILENETASKIASGTLEVFSTPMMIGFMENTSFLLAQNSLDEETTTVGISVNIKHLKANLVGDKIRCESVLKKITGKKLEFIVKVFHNEELVGDGEHFRYIVNINEFMGKLKR
ncbi:MAG: thioesterase family protein [Fusobacteriaceae bacterium]